MIVKNSVCNQCNENTQKLKRYVKETFEIFFTRYHFHYKTNTVIFFLI